MLVCGVVYKSIPNTTDMAYMRQTVLPTGHCFTHNTCVLSNVLIGQSNMTYLKPVKTTPGIVNFRLQFVPFICYSSTFIHKHIEIYTAMLLLVWKADDD